MPLVSWSSSIARRQAFEAGLQHLVGLGRLPDGLPVDPHPHPVYRVDLKAVKEEKIQESAELVGWRYFAGSADGVAVSGIVSLTSPPEVTGLQYGDSVKDALRAAETVENGLANKNYQLRALRIPGVHLDAFWLTPLAREGTGTDEWVVPYHGTFVKGVALREKISIRDFCKRISECVQKPVAETAAGR
jgi:hypothetical protein